VEVLEQAFHAYLNHLREIKIRRQVFGPFLCFGNKCAKLWMNTKAIKQGIAEVAQITETPCIPKKSTPTLRDRKAGLWYRMTPVNINTAENRMT